MTPRNDEAAPTGPLTGVLVADFSRALADLGIELPDGA